MRQGLPKDAGLNRKRAVILNTTIIFGFIVIFFRLTDLMIYNHKLYSDKAKLQQVKSEDIQVMRGNIFDRRGREFAVNMEFESLYCDAKEATIDNERINRLSHELGMEPRAVKAKLDPEKRFTWINRKLPQDKVMKVREVLSMNSRAKDSPVKGFGFINESKRYYPKGDLAAHIIGNVGMDNQPLEGIELKYDKYLRTAGGKIQFSRDASGKMLSSGVDMEATGNDIVLTIDEGLQYIAEKELAKAMTKWRSVAATAIIMDPINGEILALANRPTYDLNEIGRAGKNDVRNRAITDIYEPGSTFKIVVGTAALEEGIYDLGSAFDCSRGTIEAGGKVIHDAHRHGLLNFKEVIQKSSNVGSIMIGMKLGKERVYKYAKLFGYGDRTGIDLPGEVSGWIRKPEKWSATSIGAIPIGQEVAVTPLQVVRAYSVVANGGYLVTPHIVKEIKKHDGQTIFTFKEEQKKRVLSDKTATVFRDILKTVVEEGGTATGAAVEGNKVAGKTGTAQLIDRRTKRYSKDRFVSSFVGFVPADNPRLAMIVVVYEPKGAIYGGTVAGPVFKSIADQSLSYLNVPRDDSKEKNVLMVSK
ncbi:MAG: penicillin-binding protein 2 [Nitrospirae bacterium]|nr:penicillin-binding protein 2 [Nitrospirota bacterium]